MATLVKVRKWGSKLAIVIPTRFANARGIHVGSVLNLDPVQVPDRPRKRYKLSHLMSQFKPHHHHGEWQLGDPVGKERW